uniref:Beta-defensin-like domain-containing protein n=1 Tax=Catharus ustulatus TaxID=91951 RepID=A0A8C3U6M7_CATUS
MKILFLLFPLILLLLQGAAGSRSDCKRNTGLCIRGSACPKLMRRIGRCSRFTVCCRR